MIIRTKQTETGKTEFDRSWMHPIKNIKEAFFTGKTISDDDLTAIKNYNNEFARLRQEAINAGQDVSNFRMTQEQTNEVMKDASDNARNIANGAQGASVELEGLEKSSKAAELGMKALAAVGDMFIAWAVTWVISKAIDWLDKLVNHAKYESERLQKVKQEYSEKYAKDNETLDSLDELISKYEELRSAADYDTNTDTKKQVLDIQHQITDLVGTQASNLDLVNGKLDTQLEKLKNIKNNQSTKSVQDAREAYYASKNSSNKLVGDKQISVYGIKVGSFDATFERTKMDQESKYAIDLLLNSDDYAKGITTYMPSFLFRGITDSYGITAQGDNSKDKQKYLEGMLGYLQSKGATNNEVYNNISSAIDKYSKATDDDNQKINDYINSKLSKVYSEDTVNSLEEYKKERQQILDDMSSDQTIMDAIKNGDFNKEDLETSIDAFMSTCEGFSKWYKQWNDEQIVHPKSATDSLKEQIKEKKKELKEDKEYYKEQSKAAKKLGVDFSKTKYGNIDLNDNRKLEWTEDNLKKFGNNIASWYDTNPDIQKEYATVDDFVNHYLGSTSTIDARSEQFDGVEIAFTPMMKTKDGMEYLDADTVHTYINSLIDEANKDGKWTDEELFKLDAKGLEVDSKKIKGLIADIGDTAVKTSESMHYLGKDGSLESTARDISKDKEELKAYQALLEATKLKNFTEQWNSMGTGDTEEDKAVAEEKKNLLELAKAGKLTEDAFSNSSLSSSLVNIGLSAKEATKYINGLVTQSDQLSGMSTGITSISEILGTKKENLKSKKTRNDGISANTLAGLDDGLKDLSSWKNFEETLGDGTSSMKECRKAANKLATEWVNSNNFLSKLDDTNKDYYISTLKNMGVANAEEVVDKSLNKHVKEQKELKEELKSKNVDLTSATWDQVTATDAYKNASNDARGALIKLYAQENILSNNSLSLQGKVDELKKFAISALGAAEASKIAATALRRFSKNRSGLNSTTDDQKQYNETYIDTFNSAMKKVTKIFVKTGNGTKSSKGSGSSKGSSKDKDSSSKQTIDWIERALNRVSSTLDLIKAKAENLFGTTSLKTLQKQEASLKSQYNILKKQYSYQEKAEKKYLAKANSIKLSSSLKKAVQNGRISGSLKTLIATYGEKTANKIQNYQDYWDKAQDQKKSQQETKQAMRQNQSDRYQLHIDDADARKSRNDADLENLSTAKAKESVLKNSLTHIRTSYNYQIKQAKLENDDVKVAELKAKKAKDVRDTEVQILQNYADEYSATVSLYEAQSSSTTNLATKNDLIQKSIPVLKNQYNKLIAIAKKEGNITEQKRLQIEYQDKLNEKLKSQFDNVQDEYDFRQTSYEQRTTSINNAISLSQARGNYVGEQFYTNLLDSQKNSLKNAYTERDKLVKQREDALAKGLSLNSNEYREMTKQIWQADRNVEQLNNDIANTGKQLRDVKYALDEFKQSRIDFRNDEAEFYKTILGYKDSFDDNGNITKEGLGILTGDVFEIQNNQEKVDEYKQSLKDLDKAYENGEVGYDEYITKNEELTKSMHDAESQIYSLKDAVKSFIEDGLNKQLDALNELIDKYKKTLDSAKDLREYNKTIAEQTKNITTIQKQLAALNGDTSEEGRARIQKLQVSLKDAKDQLEDTEYDKRLSDIEDILTNLTDDFQDFIDDQMDHIDGLVDKIIAAITVNSTTSGEAITALAKEFGFTLSDSLLNYINKGNNSTGEDVKNEASNKTSEDTSNASKQEYNYNKQQAIESASTLLGKEKYKNNAAEAAAKAKANAKTSNNKNTNMKFVDTLTSANKKTVSYSDVGKSGTLKKGATYYSYALSGGIKKGDKGKTTKYAHSVTIAGFDQNGNAKLKSKTKALNGVWIPKDKLKYLTGFSTGGRVGDLQKVVKMNGDDGVTINTLKKGEEVLTPYNADLFDKFVGFLPDLVDYNNNLVDMIKPANVSTPKMQTGDLTLNIDNIELPNVTDPKEFSQGLINAMKQDKKLQRFWGDATAGSLNNNMSGIYKY